MSQSSTPPPISSLGDILAKMARYESRLAVSNAKTKTNVLAALEAAGVATVTVVFDGSGDSGGVEEVQVDGELDVLPDVAVTCFDAGYRDDDPETTNECPLREAVEYLAMSFLAEKHGGWENNEGGYGDVIFDVAAGTVTLDYNEREMTYENFSYEF